MRETYEGTRLGRQELAGDILDDDPNALWKRDNIDANRVTKTPQLVRVVVALDPSCTDTGDEAGIVVVGKDAEGNLYLIEDLSAQASPDMWARIATKAYRRNHADRIVYETNQGGQMVSLTLKTVASDIPTRGIHASRGKMVRAEPVAALSEQNKIKFVGCFPQLEDELCCFTADSTKSPNRLDAFVYACTELHTRTPKKIYNC
jgi:phage terminase large subunit-like protein